MSKCPQTTISRPCTSKRPLDVRLDDTIVALAWLEVYLEGVRLGNIDANGERRQVSSAVQSDVRVSDRSVDKYY